MISSFFEDARPKVGIGSAGLRPCIPTSPTHEPPKTARFAARRARRARKITKITSRRFGVYFSG